MLSVIKLTMIGLFTVLVSNTSHAQTESMAASCGHSLDSGQCSMSEYYESLAATESGGSGNCTNTGVGGVQGTGSGYGCVNHISALGRFQFMPTILTELSDQCLMDETTPQQFLADPCLQEEAIRAFTNRNDAILEHCGAYNMIGQQVNGVTITRSGLLAAAHLGGPGGSMNNCGSTPTFTCNTNGAVGLALHGHNPHDTLPDGSPGTYLSDYLETHGGYGDGNNSGCGEGLPNMADLFSTAQIGCDREILTMAEAAVDAFQQQQIETARAIISEPTSIEQMTCLDQQLQSMNEISDQGLGNPTGNIAQNIQQPFAQQMAALFSGGDIAGSINAIFNSFSSNLMNSFSSGLGGLMGGGGSGSTACDATETAWLINQCIEMPQLPSLADIIGGQIGEIMGQIGNIASIIQSPERILEQVCSMANSALQDSFGNLSNAFEGAAENALSPVADRFEPLSDIGN